ncbi:Pvc16 family protein [Actinophytocola sediminis]
MGDFGVVADVSTIIVGRLTRAMVGLTPPEEPDPIAVLHDLSVVVPTDQAKLTVFLYEIAEDPTSRNRPPVRSLPPDPPTTRKPPMALLLRYLVTPWGGDQLTQHQMIGRALQSFYDDAVLDGDELTGSLAGGIDVLHVTLTPLTLDQKSWVWYAIQQPYRLSLNYEIRVVNLDSEDVSALQLVRNRTIDGTPLP